MTGRLRTAVVVAAAATVWATGTVGGAYAAPGDPDPVVEPSTPAVGPSTPAVEPSTPAVEPSIPVVEPSTPAVGPSAPAVDPVGASTGDGDAVGASTGVGKLLGDLQKLYQQTEEATEAFNATEEKLKAQRAEVVRLSNELGKARVTLAEGRRAAGQLAREQYKGRGDYAYSSFVRLLTSSDPEHALMQGHALRRAAADRAVKVARLESSEKRADDLATRARAALDVQQTLAAKQKKERDAVQARLKKVEAALAALSADQLAELAALETRSVDQAQRKLLGSGAFGPGGVRASRAPSREGDRALKYATRQLGKPYVWGAEGPGSFDCSGLTQQAWAAAGRTIPRTSQEQWKELPRVPLSALRPGDLVIYFPKATHVAIYLGNGQVVQAPRPGAHVKVSPLASNPVLGAVRPDPALAPLPSYVPQDLPTGRTVEGNESDAGYGAEQAPD
ncbi:NlpC/P60 family protein [Streptomyces sp. NPDC048442]|uniref:C40 family peptidase n=1 Tax=Streptomyces sp. NPDC048442 TaxID=3154823 RepID=UPI003446CA30